MTLDFSQMISRQRLMAWVLSSAPYLKERWDSLPAVDGELHQLIQGDPLDFFRVLRAGLTWEPSKPASELDYLNYFTLCLSAHHATVGSYVPTDVDSKIRSHLWQGRSAQSITHMCQISMHSLKWSIPEVSGGYSDYAKLGPVSGINGEMLGVLAGALAACVSQNLNDQAELAAQAIDQELTREMEEVSAVLALPEPEIPMLMLSTAIMHNLGDLNQGIKYWPQAALYEPWRKRFYRLGHENRGNFGRYCALVGSLYRAIMAAEGHRNYPLREVAALRRCKDFQFPFSLFLDDWGQLLGKHPGLSQEDRVEIVSALLKGIATIPGQRGYVRALAGFFETYRGSISDFERLLPTKARTTLKDSRVRQALQQRRASFESGIRTQARAIIAKGLSAGADQKGIEGFEH